MKRIALVAALPLLAVATPALAQDWHRVAYNDNHIAYVDADSIRTDGTIRYGTILQINAEPIAEDTFASEIDHVFYCADNRFRTLEYRFFDADYELQTTEASETIDELKTPAPDSLNAAMFEFVCQRTGGTPVANPYDEADEMFDRRW